MTCFARWLLVWQGGRWVWVLIWRCKMIGRGSMHLQIKADGRMWEFQIEISLPALWCPQVVQVNSQLCCHSPCCAHRKRAGHSFITKTYWKSSWEKITAAQGERRPVRYISPAFTYSDKALGLTALSFLPLAYFVWLSFNGFLWITSLCFSTVILTLIMIQYNTLKVSCFCSTSLSAKWNWAFVNRSVTIRKEFSFSLIFKTTNTASHFFLCAAEQRLKNPLFSLEYSLWRSKTHKVGKDKVGEVVVSKTKQKKYKSNLGHVIYCTVGTVGVSMLNLNV